MVKVLCGTIDANKITFTFKSVVYDYHQSIPWMMGQIYRQQIRSMGFYKSKWAPVCMFSLLKTWLLLCFGISIQHTITKIIKSLSKNAREKKLSKLISLVRWSVMKQSKNKKQRSISVCVFCSVWLGSLSQCVVVTWTDFEHWGIAGLELAVGVYWAHFHMPGPALMSFHRPSPTSPSWPPLHAPPPSA